MGDKHYSENGPEVLVTIVNREKADYYLDLIQSFRVNMQMTVLAEGTAHPEKFSQMDFMDSDKIVIYSVIRQDEKAHLLRTLDEKFKSIRNGNGIAFTVPMSSIIGVSIFGFLTDEEGTIKEQ